MRLWKQVGDSHRPTTPTPLQFDSHNPVRYTEDSVLKFVEVFAMSQVEVLSEARSLSRLDKIRLIQVLAQDLERDDRVLIESGRSYPVWSPDQAFSAAAALLQALQEDC
jgi:hypothetical protein